MANKTVYPFGVGGQLPSNIALVNDLSTGGADKALTAEQGKVIGDIFYGGLELVDLNLLTVQSYSLLTTTWGQNGLHIAVPVTPGEKYKLTANECTGSSGFYGYLTSSYSPPETYSETIPYVANTGGRQTLSKGNSIDITIPEGCAYLCLCPQDSSSNRYTTDFLLEKVTRDTTTNKIEELEEESEIGIPSPVDLSGYTPAVGYLAGGKSWNTLKGLHIAVTITPGGKIRLRCKNSTGTGNYYGFLRSYEIPQSNPPTPYAWGCNRVWLNDSTGQVTLQVPYSATYIVLETKNGENNTSEWELDTITDTALGNAIQNVCLKTDDIVNNLVDGGTEKPLSAEQGKNLATLMGVGIPAGLEKKTYYGASVIINNKHSVATAVAARIGSVNCQGGACYGDYLFLFTENNTTCWMRNLATGESVQTITIDSADRGFVSNCHCNTVNFGTEKYDADDPFPLIYVSTGYASDGYSGALVYRIVATTVDDTTTYSLSLVQTLKIPGTGWSEFIVGDDGCCYIWQGSCYYRMKMPKLSEGDVTFDFSEALARYDFSPSPAWYNGSSGQGRFFRNGKIYMTSGMAQNGQTDLFIVHDLATCRREVEIDLINTLGLTSEPEFCFVWNGHICIAFRANSYISALYFE